MLWWLHSAFPGHRGSPLPSLGLAEVAAIPASQKMEEHPDEQSTAAVGLVLFVFRGSDLKAIHVISAHMSMTETPSQGYSFTSLGAG